MGCGCHKIINGAIGVAKNILDIDIAPGILVNQRRDICLKCEYNSGHMTSSSMCKKCGCFIILKTRLKSEECPIQKWSKIE
jgi:hypothetical protein